MTGKGMLHHDGSSESVKTITELGKCMHLPQGGTSSEAIGCARPRLVML